MSQRDAAKPEQRYITLEKTVYLRDQADKTERKCLEEEKKIE